MVLKKQYVLDELPINLKKDSGGLYAILPYNRLDSDGKALFKVGLALNFRKRFEQYHTYYPDGMYYQNLLADPNKEKQDYYYRDPKDRNKRKFSEKRYLGHIEREIHDEIVEGGGKQFFQLPVSKTLKQCRE